MKLYSLHSNSHCKSGRPFAGLIALVLTIALSAPAFAICACCDTMPAVAPVQDVAEAVSEEVPACHATEPVAEKPMECHEDTTPEPTHSGAQIVSDCKFECAKSVSVTGLAIDEMFTASGSTNIHVPSAVPTLSHDSATPRSIGHSTYKSPPDLSALRTIQYSTILPPRI